MLVMTGSHEGSCLFHTDFAAWRNHFLHWAVSLGRSGPADLIDAQHCRGAHLIKAEKTKPLTGITRQGFWNGGRDRD